VLAPMFLVYYTNDSVFDNRETVKSLGFTTFGL
jgi:hypothetical protein